MIIAAEVFAILDISLNSFILFLTFIVSVHVVPALYCCIPAKAE
jgi:hypothetical protein